MVYEYEQNMYYPWSRDIYFPTTYYYLVYYTT